MQIDNKHKYAQNMHKYVKPNMHKYAVSKYAQICDLYAEKCFICQNMHWININLNIHKYA